MKKPLFNKKALKFGALSTAITAIFVAAVIIVNLICTVLVDNFNLRFDLTDEGVFTLSQTTKDKLASLETGVDIYVTLDEIYFTQSNDAQYKHVKYLLDDYELNSKGNVTVTYNSELVNDADFINSFSFISLNVGDIVVVSRKQPEDKITNYRRFSLDDCFTQTTYETSTYDISKVENNLTSAILYLNQDGETLIACTTGHGEADLSEDAESLIKSNIFSVSTVNLAMLASLDRDEEVPADETAEETEEEEELSVKEQLATIAVMVIYCPETDFSEEELALLDIYLENNEELGKGLMVFFSPTTPKLPNLEAFLEEWGVKVNEGNIYDNERNYRLNDFVARAYIPSQARDVAKIFSSELYNSVVDAKLNLTAPYARPLTIADGYGYDTETSTGGKFGIVTYPILSSFNTAAVAKGVAPSADDETGSFLMGTMSVKQRLINNKMLSSSVCVCSSAMFVEGDFLTDSIFANDTYFVELLNFQAQRDVGVVVNAKNITTATLSMTQTQTIILMVVFIIVLPLLFVAAAITVFIRRRHL